GIQPVSGSSRPVSVLRWEHIVQDIAGEHGVYVALAQLVGFEGGKAFAGGSLVAGPRGDLIAQGPLFVESLVPFTLDFAETTRARAALPLLSDLEMRLPHLLTSLTEGRWGAAGTEHEPGGAGETTRARAEGHHAGVAAMPSSVASVSVRSRQL